MEKDPCIIEKNTATYEFIQANLTADTRQLALQSGRWPGVDMPFALNQIAGWQTARTKLPSWAACSGVTYPPHLNMEQCSSEPAARYKAEVAARVCGAGATSMADLTGGFGVDFSFVSRRFGDALYVERDESLCRIVEGNLPALGIVNARVECGDAAGVLRALEPRTMLFLDPARRDTSGGRTVFLADCTPDVCAMLPLLVRKARFVMLKLSPMLDWHKAVADLQGRVREVHIVSVGGECKELLLVLEGDGTGGGDASGCGSGPAADAVGPRVVCVDISVRPDAEGCYARSEFVCQWSSADAAVDSMADGIVPSGWLYEPNASVMKAGCFGQLARAYGLKGVARDSHLFVADVEVEGFPGRVFAIEGVATMNRRQLRDVTGQLKQANIAVRNFPMTVAELRRRLKLRDGGDTYLFATTTAGGEHVVIKCRKAAGMKR